MVKKVKFYLLSVLSAAIFFLFSGSALAFSCWTADNNQTLCNLHSNECRWQDPWCDTFDCWSFNSQTECNTNASALGLSCTWRQSNWGWCERLSCWSYEGTTETACETTSNASYGLNCEWSEMCMGGGMGVNCWSFSTESTCEAVSGCKWGSCYEKGCWSYTTSNGCAGDSRCVWDSTYNYCTETGCWRYSTSPTCIANTKCYWSSSSNSCNDKSCPNFDYNQSACVNSSVTGRNCRWTTPRCEEMGCMNYNDQTACQAATGMNCTWKTSSGGWCQKPMCDDYSQINGGSQSACESNNVGLTCKWDNGWCYVDMGNVNCANYTTEQNCMNTMYCWWDFGQQICNTPGGGMGNVVGGFMMEKWNPGCYIFDKNSSYCMNISGCSWNSTNCLSNATIVNTGIKCEYINDSSVCSNIPILSNCCQWQGTNCITDNFSATCWNNMQVPPTGASYCEDYEARSSPTLCDQIANYPWFMPCRWDNTTQECKFKAMDIFGSGGTGGFEDLNSKKNCEYGGGQWVEETYCVGTTAIPAGWCEMKFGVGGGKSCDTQCWACEYNDDGSAPTSATSVEDRCKNSKQGTCQWRTDTSAPNGYGYCEVKQDFKFGATDCDSDCWACEKKGNWQSGEDSTPKYNCEHSRAGCKWEQDLSTTDTTRGWCMPSTDNTCSEECVKCYDQASCVNKGKGGSNACTWDSGSIICKGTGTSSSEICFDGMDNDGDDNIDCSDKNCMYDPFCGGGMMGNSCSQYDENMCGQSGCTWVLTTTTSGYCAEMGEKCFEYDGNQTGCGTTAGNCTWTSGQGHCEVNETKFSGCRMLAKGDCQANSDCRYFDDPYCLANPSVCSGGWCDSKMEACMMNMSKQGNSSACGDANCIWESMDFFSGAGFGMMSGGGHCDARCFNSSMNSADLCNAVDGCKYISGWCNPAGMGTMTGGGMMMGGNCWMYDSNKTGCINTDECSWMSNPQPFCDANMSTGCGQFSYDQTVCTSTAGCRWTGSWCDNTLFDCFWNMSVSSNETVCSSKSNCQWSQQRCDIACFGQTQSKCTNSSLAPICLWKEGFCGGAMMGQMFMNMEAGAPIMLGSDTCPESGKLAALDICGLGVKEMKDTYMFGTQTNSFKDAAVCNGKYTPSGMGSGKNATMFYLYLDTDGRSTGSCDSSASAAADRAGYEFMFKYEVTWDSTNAQASETKTAYKCVDNTWVVTDIKLSNMPEKMCNEINGPMLGISKSDITKLTASFNMTKPMRVYAASADSSSNRLSPTDDVGPLYYTSGSADAKMENCMLKGADMDGDGLLSEEDPDCKWTQHGFIKSEDCYSTTDDDGDGLLNCSDPDCKCEESDCSDLPICLNLGVNVAGYSDTNSPKIVYYKIDEYVDAALLYYDTDEAANGTVSFYGNDTACATLNATINDVGVWNSNVKRFKGWHEAPFENDGGIHSLNYGLTNGTAYYYKMKVCDKSGNCLTSSCMNFTTASSLDNCPTCDFVFKLSVPTGWKVHIDLNKDNVYEVVQGDMCGATTGSLINYTRGRNVSIFLNHTADNTGLYFYGIRLSKAGYNNKIKAMSGSSDMKSGSTGTTAGATAGYAGMNVDTRDKIINKLHPQLCRVKIPGTGTCTELWHCNDNLTNCVDMSSKSTLIERGSNYCLWQIPYCEFSTWAGGRPGTSTTTTTSGTSAARGSGGGTGAMAGGTSQNPSVSFLFETIMADKDETMNINEEGLALTKVVFMLKNNISDAEIDIEAIPESELTLPKITTPAYQYVKIDKIGILDSDVRVVTIYFKVLKEWLTANSIGKENVYLMVYNGADWEKAVSTVPEVSSSITGAVIGTSTDSWKTLWDWITYPFRWLKGSITGYVVYAPSDYEYYVAKIGIMNYVAITGTAAVIEGEAAPVTAAEAAEEKAAAEAALAEEKPAAKVPWISYVFIVLVIGAIVAAFIYKRKKYKSLI